VKPLDVRAAILSLVLSALWGANPVAIKIGLLDAPPIRLAWFRFLVGGLVTVVWALATGQAQAFRVRRHEWRALVVVGVLFTLQIVSMNVGAQYTTASHAVVLVNSYAIHTVVLSHFMIPGDRMTVRKAFGTGLAYAGILALFARQWGDGPSTLVGDIVIGLGAILLAERTVYLAKAVQRLDPVKLLMAQATMGTVIFVAVSALTEASIPTRWTASLIGVVVFQGAVIAGFNFIVNLWLLKHYRPSALAAFGLTAPLFGVLTAALIAGDPITPELVLASVLVAIGIGLTTRA
jgi:drug/metabolite transporter (DMT)-like permease